MLGTLKIAEPTVPPKAILKARKPQVVPASSARSQSAKRALQRANDIVGLNDIFRTTKRASDEALADITDQVPHRPSLSPPVIPPIGGNALDAPDAKRPRISSSTRERGTMEGFEYTLGAVIRPTQRMDEALSSARRTSRDPFIFIRHLEAHPLTKEFLYCNPIKLSVKRGQPSFNPYNLEVVDYAEADKQQGYYTISAAVTV